MSAGIKNAIVLKMEKSLDGLDGQGVLSDASLGRAFWKMAPAQRVFEPADGNGQNSYIFFTRARSGEFSSRSSIFFLRTG